MSPKQSWHAWLKALIERFGTAKACAEFLEIDESKLSRWGRVYVQEPTAKDLENLAEKTKTPLPELLLMVWAAMKARNEMSVRPQMGTVGSPAAPLRKLATAGHKPLRARRRKGRAVGGLLPALAIGGGLFAGLAQAEAIQSPIINGTQMAAVYRDSVALRRRRLNSHGYATETRRAA